MDIRGADDGFWIVFGETCGMFVTPRSIPHQVDLALDHLDRLPPIEIGIFFYFYFYVIILGSLRF